MKIGVFGGSFNPIHLGHIKISSLIAKTLELDKVILIPAAEAPHKKTVLSVSGKHRLEMCRLATEGDELFEVSDIELRRGGVSYTVDTLRELTTLYPLDELYLIMGADMFLSLDKWKDYRKILTLATICTIPRDDINLEALCAFKEQLESLGGRVVITQAVPYKMSSTEVRNAASQGEELSTLVGKKVADYIKEYHLYTETLKMNDRIDEHYKKIDEYTQLLKQRLSIKRFEHSLNVAKEAVRLAKRYGADQKKAELAGLLHDIMKNTDAKEQLAYMMSQGMELTELEISSEKLWHAMAGSCYVKNALDFEDEDIINAIRYHTTARAGMSLLEKIIYLADYTSEERDYNGVERMRAAVDISLEAAMEEALSFSLCDLAQRARVIHPDTLGAFNEIILEKQNVKFGGQQ